ncbi:restriction endonuclease subunit S [Anabaena azotica]|uniref:Restriction endonuclease subunit S n=1 Tax=Anabaena azotica FACHB-119 TaxID=947527 RepID=A0ABR8D5E1_9NOST|nr:restriction endonuclease subunit S [Anabaena azotica]MBD2501457.1 restriction endonuclease subunit S [Anabaena azotica FACHB-119]
MEKAVINLSDLRKQKRWDFYIFSSASTKIEKVLKKIKYPIFPLQEIVKRTERGFSGTLEYRSDGIPVLSLNCITAEGVAISNANKFMSLEEHHKLYRSAVKRNDVLVGLFLRPNMNISAVYEFDEPANITSFLVKLELKEVVYPQYLSMFLNSSFGKDLIQQKAIGSIQPSITISHLRDLPIPLPPLDEQKSLVEAIRHKQIEALELQRKATKLMEEAGEIIENFFKSK